MEGINEIMDWIWWNLPDAELRLGIWDEEEGTFYSLVETDRIRIGESSYGSLSLEEAIGDLLDELGKEPDVRLTPIAADRKQRRG